MAQAPAPPPLHIREPRLTLVQDSFDVFTGALEAAERQHKNDLGRVMAEVAVLRKQLEDAGIEPASHTGAEYLQMFRQAAEVVRVAQ